MTEQTCSGDCSLRGSRSMIENPHSQSRVKKVIGVVSGKGGVGKSLVTSMLAVLMRRRGYSVAILDADISGASIPRSFGITENLRGSEDGLLPAVSRTGIRLVSSNLLLDDESRPLVWRGPVISGLVKQFWTDVIWGDVDYMFVDMPPGTGDVPLTVFQSLPVDGIVIITSPQELVAMIVEKAVKMAEMMGIPILGLVENSSHVRCPDCGGKIFLYGESRLDELTERYGIAESASLPIDPKLTAACDKGMIELFDGNWLDRMATRLEALSKE